MRPITVDTGGPDDIFEGALVTWIHIPEGGYGFSVYIDAVVKSHSRRPGTKVKIWFDHPVTREKIVKTVEQSTLRWRSR